jgi:hypothetical protein
MFAELIQSIVHITLFLSVRQEQYHCVTTCPQARVHTAKRPTDDLNGQMQTTFASRFQDCRLLLRTFFRILYNNL